MADTTDLNTDKVFVSHPDGRKPRVLVLGCGVSGLTTAWQLLDSGCEVTVLAKQFAPATPNISSEVAVAVWELPPATCGSFGLEAGLTDMKRWARESYERFYELGRVLGPEATGIRERLTSFFFMQSIESIGDGSTLTKINELAQMLPDSFRRGIDIARDRGVNTDPEKGGFPLVDAYEYNAVVIDAACYLPWLTKLIVSKGAKLLTGTVTGLLRDRERELLREYSADIIVNCTGYGAKELTNDAELHPLRGFLIHVDNAGETSPRIDASMLLPHVDGSESDASALIIPRSDNLVVLGTSVQMGESEIELAQEPTEVLEKMRRDCVRLYPPLEKAKFMPRHYQVGIRPFRKRPRVERESGTAIFHNYGHGGSGVSLSFGCARDMLALVKEYFDGLRTTEASRAAAPP